MSEVNVPEKHVERLKTYRACIASAKQHMADEGLHEKWKRFIRVYAENTCGEMDKHLQVHVPIGFSNVNIQRAALTVHHPKFTINPRTADSLRAAAICEQALNYEWHKHGYQDQIRKTTDDFLIMGNMWGKCGYLLRKWGSPSERVSTSILSDTNLPDDLDFDVFEDTGFDTEFDKLIEENREVLWQHHGVGDTLPTRSSLARQLRRKGHAIIHDRTMFERVSPFDMLVDPKATCLENAQWVAQRVPVRLDVAQANTDWPKHVRDALGAKEKIGSESQDVANRPEPNYRPSLGSYGEAEAHRWVIMWELYDLHTGEWCHFADEGTDFLRRPEPSPFRTGHPFVFRGNYSVPDRFYHIGEIEMIESLQKELNQTRQDLVSARGQIRRKYLIEDWLMNDAQAEGMSAMDVIKSPEDNLVAKVTVPNGKSVKDAICLLPQHQVDPNLYNVFASIMSDMNQVTGITDFQRGASSAGASTATEAAILNDGALARLQEKQGKIEGFMRDAGRRLVMLKQEHMTSDHALRITDGGQTQAATQFRDRLDEEGIEVPQGITGMFVTYGRNDIVGEFDFEVEAGSTTAYNETARRRQYQELLQTLVPFIGVVPIDLQAILIEVLQQGFRLPNAARFIQAQNQEQPQPANPVTGQQGGGIPGISTQAGVAANDGGIPSSQSGVAPDFQALLNQVLPNGTLAN